MRFYSSPQPRNKYFLPSSCSPTSDDFCCLLKCCSFSRRSSALLSHPKGRLTMSHKVPLPNSPNSVSLAKRCVPARVWLDISYYLTHLYLECHRKISTNTPWVLVWWMLSAIYGSRLKILDSYLSLHWHSNFPIQVIPLVFKKRSERGDPHSPRMFTAKLYCPRFHQLEICLG